MNEAIKRAAEAVHGQAALARAIGVQPPTVNQWLSGLRPVPAERCAAIELATEGRVTRIDLRPEDWHRIWPELAEKHPELVPVGGEAKAS